ncbi:MAG: AbrB family transcriptional regulator [Loktanella sp.]|nr:AbrB family transcriptional regulator [Loktanella sp.]
MLELPRTLRVLAIGTIAGFGTAFFGLPLPWLIGSLVITAALSLSGLNVSTPPLIRQSGQLIAAIAIGLGFSSQVMAMLSDYVYLIIFSALASVALGIVAAWLVSKMSEIPFETAYFSSMPGGVAEMSVLAQRFGGDSALVATAQSIRIIIVVLSIPIVLDVIMAADIVGNPSDPTTFKPWLKVVPLLILGGGLGLALSKMGVMNAFFLAGLAVGATVAIAELSSGVIPAQAVNAAQVLIGCALGGRIDPRLLTQLRAFLPITTACTLALILFNAAIAVVLHYQSDLPVSVLLLATAPGGVAEMSITAKAFMLAAPLVTAFHLTRIILIVVFSAPLYRACARVLS